MVLPSLIVQLSGAERVPLSHILDTSRALLTSQLPEPEVGAGVVLYDYRGGNGFFAQKWV